MATPPQVSLSWTNYSQHIVKALDDLRVDDDLADVTLSCEGQKFKAHKILLAACSSFFRNIFKENPCKHLTIIIKGVSFADLEAVTKFMYNGQVNVSPDKLQTFLAAAELLQIKGLPEIGVPTSTPPKKIVARRKRNLVLVSPEQSETDATSSSQGSSQSDASLSPLTPEAKRAKIKPLFQPSFPVPKNPPTLPPSKRHAFQDFKPRKKIQKYREVVDQAKISDQPDQRKSTDTVCQTMLSGIENSIFTRNVITTVVTSRPNCECLCFCDKGYDLGGPTPTPSTQHLSCSSHSSVVNHNLRPEKFMNLLSLR